jgi:hypothetical protein
VAVKTFDEFIERLTELRTKYATGQIKLNANSLYTVIMAGTMDGLFPTPPTLQERFAAMEKVRIVLKSKTYPAEGKKGELGIADIKTDLDRSIWLAQRNPFYCFRFADEYSHALKVLGYTPTGKPNLVGRDLTTDVFNNWNILTTPKAVEYYTNKNVNRQIAIVAQYQGFETRTYSRGQFLKLKMFDGSRLFEGAVWPEYGKTTFPAKITSFIKSSRRKVALFKGKLTSSKGFVNLTITSITELN